MRRSLSLVALLFAVTVSLAADAAPAPQIIPDIIYGRKDGMALTLDIIKPAKPNGAAVRKDRDRSLKASGISGWTPVPPEMRGTLMTSIGTSFTIHSA